MKVERFSLDNLNKLALYLIFKIFIVNIIFYHYNNSTNFKSTMKKITCKDQTDVS